VIALDTNALVRLAVGDDPDQAARVQQAVLHAQERNVPVLILDGVLMETAWVLISGYGYAREDVAELIEALLSSDAYAFQDRDMLHLAVLKLRQGGDLADILFALTAKGLGADTMLSFDRKFQALFPEFVREP